MNRFNQYFVSGFSGCKLVATGFDPHRERDVRMFLMPGITDCLGVTDTVDSWVAPLNSPFLEKVAKAVAIHFEGGTPVFPIALGSRPGAPEQPRGRTRLRLHTDPPAESAPVRGRVKLMLESPPCLPFHPRTRIRIK